MCGMFGFFDGSYTGFNQLDVKSINGLYQLTSLRGKHSSSLIGLDKDNLHDPDVYKVLGLPSNLWKSPMGKMYKNRITTKYNHIIGHCRAATVGQVNLDNAHPFFWKDIIFMHNGTFHQTKPLLDRMEDHKIDNTKNGHVLKTDSEMLCRLVAELGPVDALKDLYGAYALIWYDKEKKKVYFVRNSQRPLHYLELSAPKSFMVASEESTLQWYKSYTNPTDKGSKIKQFDVHKVYEFDPNSMKLKQTETIPSITHYSGSYYQGSHSNSNWSSHSNSNWGNKFPIMNSKAIEKKSESGVYPLVKKNYKPGEECFFRVHGKKWGFLIANDNPNTSMFSGSITGNPIFHPNVQVRGFDKKANIEKLRAVWEGEETLYKGIVEKVIEINTYFPEDGVTYKARIMLAPGSVEVSSKGSVEVSSKLPDEVSTYNYVVLAENKSISEEEFGRLCGYGCYWCKMPLYKEQAKDIGRCSSGGLLCPDCNLSYTY